jgi:hypothetical protein
MQAMSVNPNNIVLKGRGAADEVVHAKEEEVRDRGRMR